MQYYKLEINVPINLQEHLDILLDQNILYEIEENVVKKEKYLLPSSKEKLTEMSKRYEQIVIKEWEKKVKKEKDTIKIIEYSISIKPDEVKFLLEMICKIILKKNRWQLILNLTREFFSRYGTSAKPLIGMKIKITKNAGYKERRIPRAISTFSPMSKKHCTTQLKTHETTSRKKYY